MREEIGGTSRATRAETTLGDERESGRERGGERERERLEWQSRKANLTFISGILGFTPENPFEYTVERKIEKGMEHWWREKILENILSRPPDLLVFLLELGRNYARPVLAVEGVPIERDVLSGGKKSLRNEMLPRFLAVWSTVNIFYYIWIFFFLFSDVSGEFRNNYLFTR